MAVVINEFEVVPETEAPPQPEGQSAGPAPLPAPSSEDLVARLRQQAERIERVWAH